jgi:hypothetical protein
VLVSLDAVACPRAVDATSTDEPAIINEPESGITRE